MSHVLVIDGPNLNLLGRREPDKYGTTTLADIRVMLEGQARGLEIAIDFFQANAEGALIERVHAAANDATDLIVMNPAGYTHTSVALRDAVLGVGLPLIEVHLSNVHAREPFRAHSYFSDIAIGTVAGFGAVGYSLALTAAAAHLAAGA